MPLICDEVPMAKKKLDQVPPSPPDDDPARVTVLNLKGTAMDRDFLRRASRKTGVPASEIARRSMGWWLKDRYGIDPPADWVGE